MSEDKGIGESRPLPEPKFATLPEPPAPPDRCPRCRMPIVVGAPVCNACGARIAPEVPPDVPIPDAPWEAAECPRCGRPMESGVVASSSAPETGGIVLDLSFFPPPPKGSRTFEGRSELIFQRPKLWGWDRKDLWPLWRRCPHCRLLRYPELPPVPR